MSLWVLGTDTGVGKTITSALILNRYGSQEKLAYWKPVSTGGDADRDRTTVAALLEPQIEVLPESYLLQMPVSPHLAARREGVEIEPGRILEDLERHRAADPGRGILIEGAGGVLVPLTDRRDLLVDTVAATALPVVLVARSTLGTINHTLLTLEALRSREVEVVGVVLNGPLNAENRSAIENHGETTIISEVASLVASWTGRGAPTGVPSLQAVSRAAGGFDHRGILCDYLKERP